MCFCAPPKQSSCGETLEPSFRVKPQKRGRDRQRLPELGDCSSVSHQTDCCNSDSPSQRPSTSKYKNSIREIAGSDHVCTSCTTNTGPEASLLAVDQCKKHKSATKKQKNVHSYNNEKVQVQDLPERGRDRQRLPEFSDCSSFSHQTDCCNSDSPSQRPSTSKYKNSIREIAGSDHVCTSCGCTKESITSTGPQGSLLAVDQGKKHQTATKNLQNVHSYDNKKEQVKDLPERGRDRQRLPELSDCSSFAHQTDCCNSDSSSQRPSTSKYKNSGREIAGSDHVCTSCGCTKESTTSTGPPGSLLAVDQGKKHQTATKNLQNVHSYDNEKEQVKDLPERGRDRQRLPELSDCSSFSHQRGCCNSDSSSQRPTTSKYKNSIREIAGSDQVCATCGCAKESTTSTGPQASLLAVDQGKKHQTATKNQKNVHSFVNEKEQVQDIPERGRDRQRISELSDCSSFSDQIDCCNSDSPSQRSSTSKYKNSSRVIAGSDRVRAKDLKNSISTTSLNEEVAKLKGLSTSMQEKLSAGISCGTSVMSVMERASNGYSNTASSKSESPSSQLKQKSSSLSLNHSFGEKSPSTQLTTQSSKYVRQSIPHSQSSSRNTASQTKISLRHLTPQSKRAFTQSKSFFRPSLPQHRSPFNPSSPQLRSPLRLSPFPSENSLKPPKSHVTKQLRPRCESCDTPSRINFGKSSSLPKSNKYDIGQYGSALRQSESSSSPLRRFESPLKQSESSFFPSRQFESPLKHFDSSLRRSESFSQKSETPAWQSESPLKKPEIYLNHLHNQSKSPFKRSYTHFKSQTKNPSKNLQTHSRSSLEYTSSQSKKETPFKKTLSQFEANATRLQSGENNPFKQSEVNYSLNYVYSQPEESITNSKYVYNRSREASPFTYSRQKTEANWQPKANGATVEEVRHRSRTNSPSKHSHSRTEAYSSSSPQSEVILRHVRHGSKANSTSKHSNPNSEANNSSKYLSSQFELKADGTLEHVRQRSRANSPSKHTYPNSEANNSSKYFSAQSEQKSSTRSRSRANSTSKHSNPNSEAINSSKYLSSQFELKADGTLEHVRQRSRVNSPSKHTYPNSEANNSSKYFSAQSEQKNSTRNRSRANSPSKYSNPNSEANISSKYLSSQYELQADGTLEHVRQRSRANGPSKHTYPNSEANNSSKYFSAQSEEKTSTRHRSRANSPSKYSNPNSEISNSTKYLSAQFEEKNGTRHRSRGNSPLKMTEPAANSNYFENVRHVSRSDSTSKHSNPNSEAKYLSAQSETNSSSRHQSRAHSPSKPSHPKSERNDSPKQAEANNSNLKRFTSRSRANNLLKLYPSKKNFPKPNLQQSATNSSLKYLSAQFQCPAYERTSKHTRSWERSPLKYPTRANTSSDSISISSSPSSLNKKKSTQSLPKRCTKEMGCQSQFESQAKDSTLKQTVSLSRLYSPLKSTPANITLNITLPTQTEKNSSLKSFPSPRTVPNACTKEVGCQKESDHADEDDERISKLSALKAVLNQTINPVRQEAGYHNSQTQTEISVLKSRSKLTATNKSGSLISMRQMAGYQSENIKQNCKCQCKCGQRTDETILPKIMYENEMLPDKNKETSSILPRKSREEDVLPRKSREEDILPSIFQEEDTLTRKSREEEISPRKCKEVEEESVDRDKRFSAENVAKSSSIQEEKRRSNLSDVLFTKSPRKSCICETGYSNSTRSALQSDEQSPEIPTNLRRQSLRNSISSIPNAPECKCKCSQVTPSVLDGAISSSKTRQFSVQTTDSPNDAQITYKPSSKYKTKTPKTSGCDNPAYYPPLLDCNILVKNPNFTNSNSKPAPSPSCILVKNCLRSMISSQTNIQNRQLNSRVRDSDSCPNDSSINNSGYARESKPQNEPITSYTCDSDSCAYKSSSGKKSFARASKSQSDELNENFGENRLSNTPSLAAGSRKSYNQSQASSRKSSTSNITHQSKNQRGQCQLSKAEQIQCKFGTQSPTSVKVLSVSRKSRESAGTQGDSRKSRESTASQGDSRKSKESTGTQGESRKSTSSSQKEPKVVQQILVESNAKEAAPASGDSDLSFLEKCKNCNDYAELTPLERPNAIEGLKKELLCTFPTTCTCNPCYKIYPKSGCSCKAKQNNRKNQNCCSSAPQTQLVCSNNHCSPSHKTNYCYKPGCCPSQDSSAGAQAPLVCCTIDPNEALKRATNSRPKPVCNDKCIIEELLLGNCSTITEEDETDCNCNCNCNSSDTCCRCAHTRNNDCCAPKSRSDPICCCCCTYPSDNTDIAFWQKQVAINNISALPCAKQSIDPENGAEKITGENCVPPCRCCCRSRKRPAIPNYCKTKSCCTETSPCCSESELGCNEEEEAGCCCCSQTPCCCTIDTTAPGPVCFYCKSIPCRCCDEDLQASNSSCRCKGGGTMSNDYDYATEKDCSVRVAVRIRPQNPREVIDMCRICTTVTPGEPHVILGQDKAFTFDYVYDINCIQCDIYTTCVERLVEGALRGYNATVLAYGQTGSGKTFTMGTGFDHDLNEIQQGIIPRAVRHIFAGIEEMQQHEYDDTGTQINTTQFSVGAQFMELYNEEIFDLLDPYSKSRGGGFKIHEDCTGQISVSGATISPVHGPQDALRCLQQGALARTTAATQMNEQSSRSHALFTILIRRQRMLTPDESGCPEGDLETLTSKFHFVDLAGSERLKRTGATGERAREGISINSGLLALGNCISALGDKSKKATHVPYRDSKLTRLLQDSLGGNSQTLMIACVSPCDRDFMETLNTLKYANRARNIKNKVQLNQDQSSRTIAQLRREIAALQMELLEYKQGKRLLDDEGNSCISDTFHENSMLLADNKRLQQRLKAMQETINVLTDNNTSLKVERETHGWSTSLDSDRSVTNMVAGYLSEIEKLHAKLIESEEMYQQVKKNASGGSSHRAAAKLNSMENPQDVINLAKRELEKDRELLMSRSLPGLQEDTSNSNNMVTTAINNESFESDSDTESDDKANEMQADLIDINTDIEIKTKLIEQLELSQQRMQLMRQHYEDKLSLLNSKIVNTQKERDEVLANMGPTPVNQPNEKVKKVKEEYERKINDMQREMKKLQQAQREHLRQQRELQAQEVKVRNLRTELTELKCIKTRLIRKMTDQTNRHKEEETRKAREIAQLRKEQRRQQNAVKSLQAQVHAKDQILKRKTEEVTALRRSKRDKLSQKASGRVPSKHREKDIAAYNSRQTRQRWDNLYRAITRASRNKQAVMQLEKELERLMNERETLCRDLTVVQKRQRTSGTKNIDLANEEDTIKSNLNYVQDNIAHVQQAIMEFEESKDINSTDTQNLQLLIQNVNDMDEAKFLLEHLTNSAIMFQCDSALTQNRLAEHESLLKEVQQESSIQQQLLQHFLAQNNSIQISDLFASLHLDGSGDKEKLNSNNLSGSQKSLNSNGTYDIPCEGGGNMSSSYVVQQRSVSRSPSPTPTVDLLHDKYAKVRRRTAQPQDLLFGEVSHNGDDAMTRSYTQQDTTQRNFHPLMRVPSAPGSLKQGLNSPSLTKKNIETAMASTQPQSPRLTRRGMPNKGSPGLDDDSLIAPQSPPVYRKMISREENSNGSGGSTDVFSRLGAGIQDPAPGGSIHKVTGKIRVGVPLYCTHTVSGHNNSVLSIKVDDDDILYTAAADRTVKVWDLSREVAQHCLSTHPGPVIAVQNDKTTRLLFSASGPYVRVWDLRTSNSKPIKTLTSSGQVLAGNANITGVAPGESPITALCLGNSGNLYVAASDKVRIWDLKNISCVGKLSGGHQAAVMCVTAWEGDGGDSDGSTDFVATGSKDHYVKVFEVPKAGGVVYPLLNLEPPHYDGVQALAVAPDAVGADAELFSGSRDSGIKRWDLKSGELKQSLNNAHKGWVSGMAISGDVLLSSCRGGIVRLWNVRTCESLAELKTDLMINDIVASGQRVFTASSSGEVRIWRFAPQEHFPTTNMSSSSIEKK